MDVQVLGRLATEEINENTTNIDRIGTLDIIEMINEEDKKVAIAVGKAKENIAASVDLIVDRVSRGGRLIYVGAGTSGRLGILDASECLPTFGVNSEMVQGIIAGGYEAVFRAAEGAEDNYDLGKEDLIQKKLNSNDVVCGIAASGRTPYVMGAMEYGKKVGAAVIAVNMNDESEMAALADISISVVVGPEVIMGSTRMKAGTAQKMILNMLTTATMIKLGKVYHNLMVDVQPTNEKLKARAKRIVKLATDADYDVIERLLIETQYNVKLSILMLETGFSQEECKVLLSRNNGYIYKASNKIN